jgi:uncharacterized membrane protein
VPLRLSALVERLRTSLFFVPLLFVITGAALGIAMVRLDDALDPNVSGSPLLSASTVESAREILGVVATATITVAGVAFSIALLVIQQASSQYSPRVVHSLFRDPFNRRVMGVALGTFTYALMVLRAVRSPLDDGGDAVIPNLSVGLAVLLGVVAILAVVAFIDHNAHTMEVSQLLDRVTRETIEEMDHAWPRDTESTSRPAVEPNGPGHPLLVQRRGWVQQVDEAALLDLVPDGGTVRLELRAGRYAIEGTVLCTVWPPPDDPDHAEGCAADAIGVGPSRTMHKDPTYGIRQLADVALIALSPGVNDPSTAQDAVFHLADVSARALNRDLPPDAEHDEQGRLLIRAERPTHGSVLGLAFDEIRRAAATYPTVCIYLLEALHLIDETLADDAAAHRALVHRHAALVVAGAEHADLLPEDLAEVQRAHRVRFGGGVTEPTRRSVRAAG